MSRQLGDVFYLVQGNVGIGTSLPQVSLDLQTTDALKIPSGSNHQRPNGRDGLIRYNNQLQQFEGYSKNEWGTIGGGSEGYWSCNQDTLFYSSNNVGIGTNVAQYRLDVDGTLRATNILTSNLNAISLSGSVITDSISTISSSIAASATAVKTAYDLAANALSITGGTVSGDVNILANLFTSNLTVIGEYTTLNTITSNTEQMIIENAGTGPALKVTQTGPQPVAEFYDQESGLALIIGNNGNVGIGSALPANRLDVLGNVSINGTLTTNHSNINVGTGTVIASVFQGTATQVSQTLIRGNYLTGNNYNGSSSTTWDVDGTTTATANKVVVRDSTGGMYGSTLGIGTTIARQLLDVEGNAYIMGNVGIGTLLSSYPLTVEGTLYATGITGSAITDSVSTTSSMVTASATAVKTAYDLAANALPLTGGTLSGNFFAPEVATSNLAIYSSSALQLPSGSNNQRPVGTDGLIRYNQEYQQFEGYSKNNWGAISGGSEGYWSCNQTTLFYSSNNVGIGTNVAQYRLDVSGSLKADTIYTSNIRFLSGTNIQYQVPPVRYITYIDASPIDTFVLSTQGIYQAVASNLQVYVNNDLLFYYSSNVKDYDVSYVYQPITQQTLFTLTLEKPAPFGSLVDIVLWPQLINENSNIQFSFGQTILFPSGSSSQFQSFSNDLYTLGNLGIGTSNTTLGRLVVGGNILPSSNLVYDLGSSNNRWRDIYLSGNTIDLGGTKITRDSQTGGIQVLSITGTNVDFSARNIYTTGNLGIGTLLPQSRLHVLGDGSQSFFQLDIPQTTSSQLNYPPIGLSQETTIVSGQLYGNGSYTVTASSYYSPHDPFYAFDYTLPSASSKWISQINLYNSSGNYVGSQQTIHTTGTVNGEWIQLQLPSFIQISSYSMGQYSDELLYNRSPYQWYFLGSSNGTTWTLLDTINNYTSWSGDQFYNFNVSNPDPYIYYRWVFNQLDTDPAGGCVSVNEIKLSTGSILTTYTPCLIANASGNLGIGTTVPTQALDIRGNIYSSGNIVCSNISVIGDYVRLNTITSNTEQMVIENAGTGPALKVTQIGNNSVAEFYDKESGIAMFVGNNGNVGIGTNSPLALLDVNGSIRLGTSGSSLSILGCLYPIILGGALSDETTALSITNTLKLYAPFNLNIRSLKLPKFTVNTAATSTITFDVTKNGTTIYSSKPTITNGNKYSTNGTLTTNPTSFSENDEIVASVNSAGTGGTGAKVYIYCT